MTLLEQASLDKENRQSIDIAERHERVQSGIQVEYVTVYDESYSSETAVENKTLLDTWNEQLISDMSAQSPLFNKEQQTVTVRNQISEQFYSLSGTKEWGLLMPSARALYYLTHLDDPILPSGDELSAKATEFMCDMDDGIGIRTRKRIASEVVKDYLAQAGSDVQCLSLACGAADLMLEALAEIDSQAFLHLVDIDDASLDLARRIATNEALVEGRNYEIIGVDTQGAATEAAKQRNLLRSMVASNSLVQHLGFESQRIVDAIGINEYFDDKTASRFLANAYDCVEPGGALITSNMLKDRSQMAINQIAIGWQDTIKPRSIDELSTMVAGAGLPLDQTRVIIPEDGIYAVLVIHKPQVESRG